MGVIDKGRDVEKLGCRCALNEDENDLFECSGLNDPNKQMLVNNRDLCKIDEMNKCMLRSLWGSLFVYWVALNTKNTADRFSLCGIKGLFVKIDVMGRFSVSCLLKNVGFNGP